MLNPIQRIELGELLAMDIFASKASLPETPSANRYILKMIDKFSQIGEGQPMPEKTAQTVTDSLVSQSVFLFGAPRCLLPDKAANRE